MDPNLNLSTTKDLAIILAGVVALTTFFTGVLEYARQGSMRRAEQFVQMRRRFLETELFREILNRLAIDDSSVLEIPVQDRRNFIGFFEEVALLVNSEQLRPEVAHYMFGYYVRVADTSVALWEGLNKEDRYWTLFRDFAATMHEMEQRALTSRRRLRL